MPLLLLLSDNLLAGDDLQPLTQSIALDGMWVGDDTEIEAFYDLANAQFVFTGPYYAPGF